MPTLHPHLMFEGQCEEALTFYVSLFVDGEIIAIERYGPGGPPKEGSVIHATFHIAGQLLTAIDSYATHAFTFTPSLSLFITCDDEAQLDTLYAKLVQGGKAMMPLGSYGFSQKFGWVADRFGVSWQLNLP